MRDVSRSVLELGLLCGTAILVVGTSTASETPTWSLKGSIEGSVILDELAPDQVSELEVALSASSAGGGNARATLEFEVTAVYTPPAVGADPGAPELVVGLAQGNFAPEGQARASGVPVAGTPLVLSATRGALVTCEISAGCSDTLSLHLLAGSLPAGAEIAISWTLVGAIEGAGRSSPPPGVALSLTPVP